MLKKAVKKSILRPQYIRHCPSTLYQALLGCLQMWEATHALIWRERAEHVAKLLVGVQNPDGGFDMGYAFDFGKFHRKGQSQSALQIALVAFAQFSKVFGAEPVRESARRAVEWIRRNALRLPGDKYAIAYSPDTVNEVRVYNGVSIACGALGCYLGYIEPDTELMRMHHGMIAYLNSIMSKDQELPGRFWYYHEQSCEDLDDMRRYKVDYYHQMIQVWFHALAEQACPCETQRRIICDAADHIVAIHEVHGIIPYCNRPLFFKGLIHLWGLAAVVPGMLEAALVIPSRKSRYHNTARFVIDWIIKYGWNGNYFDSVLNRDGTCAENGQYMVRSDAWVFGALASATKHWGSGPWTSIAEMCYSNILAVDFSGPESHAQTWYAKACSKALAFVRRLRESKFQ